MLKAVYSHGDTFWDTANVYIFPDWMRLLTLRSPIVFQEEIIGKAIAKVCLENIVIGTKTGLDFQVIPKPSAQPRGDAKFI